MSAVVGVDGFIIGGAVVVVVAAVTGGAVVGVLVGVTVCALIKVTANNDSSKEAKNLLTFSGIFEVSIILFEPQ